MLFNENKIRFFDELNSTNEYASQISFEPNIEEGFIVWTLNQTKGKGQKGNIWQSENAKNLTFSVILKPHKILPAKQFNLNMAVSLSLIDFLKSLLPENNVFIKWPNDIYVEKKKIAGILIENQIIGNEIENSIIGIGLNVNQNKFPNEIPNPISLNIISLINYNLNEILLKYLPFLNNRIIQLYNIDFKKLKSDYLNCLLYFDELKQFKIKNEIINAKIIDINEYGKLVLITDNQIIHECDLKEVEFIHN